MTRTGRLFQLMDALERVQALPAWRNTEAAW
jgi:hypothetical protein